MQFRNFQVGVVLLRLGSARLSSALLLCFAFECMNCVSSPCPARRCVCSLGCQALPEDGADQLSYRTLFIYFQTPCTCFYWSPTDIQICTTCKLHSGISFGICARLRLFAFLLREISCAQTREYALKREFCAFQRREFWCARMRISTRSAHFFSAGMRKCANYALKRAHLAHGLRRDNALKRAACAFQRRILRWNAHSLRRCALECAHSAQKCAFQRTILAHFWRYLCAEMRVCAGI